ASVVVTVACVWARNVGSPVKPPSERSGTENVTGVDGSRPGASTVNPVSSPALSVSAVAVRSSVVGGGPAPSVSRTTPSRPSAVAVTSTIPASGGSGDAATKRTPLTASDAGTVRLV